MSEAPHPPPTPPAPTIAYAQPLYGTAAAAEVARPTLLLPPNLLALALPFLAFANDDSPFDVLTRFAWAFRASGVRTSQFWDAMVTSPFLLALPLAAWTLRLTISPRARRGERGAAWGIACSCAAVTLVVTGFCGAQLRTQPRFLPAFVVTLLILALAGSAVWSLRRLVWTYAPALLAMTAAFAANTAMTILVVRSHASWAAGSVMGTIVVLWQLVASAVLFLRWRGAARIV